MGVIETVMTRSELERAIEQRAGKIFSLDYAPDAVALRDQLQAEGWQLLYSDLNGISVIEAYREGRGVQAKHAERRVALALVWLEAQTGTRVRLSD